MREKSMEGSPSSGLVGRSHGLSRSGRRRWSSTVARLIAVSCGLLITLPLSGCAVMYPTPPAAAPLDGFPLRRFDRVDEGVYRSGQPSAGQLRELSTRYGIRAVLKLNGGAEPVSAGVSVLHRPLSVMSEPDPATLRSILDELEASPKPVLVHCTHGEDRTGLVVALYRMRHGVPSEVAYADMVRHGFHPYPGVWRAWLRSAGWAQAEVR